MTPRAKILLKARPTPAQLADRLAPPRPDGLELYLDAHDLAPSGWLPRLREIMRVAPSSEEFAYVVEGPIRSLDGEFFDVTRDAPADREALARLADFGAEIGATVAVIHLIAPAPVATALWERPRDERLARAMPLLDYYQQRCLAAGLVPTIENIPPVARMREGATVFSTLGVEPADLVACVKALPALRVTFDTSHAGLYLQAVAADLASTEPELRPAIEHYRGRAQVTTLEAYLDLVERWVVNVHVSNAAGLLGEGLPYAEGAFDLNGIVPRLAGVATFLVTETLESDQNRAVHMRDAQARITAALGPSSALAGDARGPARASRR